MTRDEFWRNMFLSLGVTGAVVVLFIGWMVWTIKRPRNPKTDKRIEL